MITLLKSKSSDPMRVSRSAATLKSFLVVISAIASQGFQSTPAKATGMKKLARLFDRAQKRRSLESLVSSPHRSQQQKYPSKTTSQGKQDQGMLRNSQ